MFAIAKRPHYANYEVLCNALSARVIDYSQAEIYALRNSEMKKEELERVLAAQHEVSYEKFAMRWLQLKALDRVESAILKKDIIVAAQDLVVRER